MKLQVSYCISQKLKGGRGSKTGFIFNLYTLVYQVFAMMSLLHKSALCDLEDSVLVEPHEGAGQIPVKAQRTDVQQHLNE